jgi:hypothetical protein
MGIFLDGQISRLSTWALGQRQVAACQGRRQEDGDSNGEKENAGSMTFWTNLAGPHFPDPHVPVFSPATR